MSVIEVRYLTNESQRLPDYRFTEYRCHGCEARYMHISVERGKQMTCPNKECYGCVEVIMCAVQTIKKGP